MVIQMNRVKAEKKVRRKLTRAKPCPFCGSIPKITAWVEPGHNSRGSIGHWYNRNGCCKATGIGQAELFFCNHHKSPDFGLWWYMVCRAVNDWNQRVGGENE